MTAEDRPAETARQGAASFVRRARQPRANYIGLPGRGWRDGYHLLLSVPLWAFFAIMAAVYVAINAVFALIYMADPNGVVNARPGDFADHFFFSVQTLGGLGYGVMWPRSQFCNLAMTLELFIGLFYLASATGLLFARISRPTARIMFSQVAVVAPFEGRQALMFRAANRRRNLVVEAEVSLSLVKNVTTAEGVGMRRYFDLPVVRARTPLFFLTWQVIHVIDEESPLHGETAAGLAAARAEIVAVMRGLDEAFATTIHARAAYAHDQIVWGRRLKDIFVDGADGRTVIDFNRFHEVEDR